MPPTRPRGRAPKSRPRASASPRRPSPTSCATPARAICGCASSPREATSRFPCAMTAPDSTWKRRGAAARPARAWAWSAWRSVWRSPAARSSCARRPDRARYCWQHSRWPPAKRSAQVDPRRARGRPRPRARGPPLAPERDAGRRGRRRGRERRGSARDREPREARRCPHGHRHEGHHRPGGGGGDGGATRREGRQGGEGYVQRVGGDAGPDVLTARQREVLRLVAGGKSTKEIAFALNLSVKTVETHRAQIMERLGIRDVAGLVRYALRTGLIPPEG